MSDLLERQFNLVYYTGLTATDINEMDDRELEWMYNRLVQQFKDEKAAKG